MEFSIVPNQIGMMIQADEVIFFRGVDSTTNQLGFRKPSDSMPNTYHLGMVCQNQPWFHGDDLMVTMALGLSLDNFD